MGSQQNMSEGSFGLQTTNSTYTIEMLLQIAQSAPLD